MCEPVSAISAGVTLAAAAYGAFAADEQGDIAKAAGKRNETIANQAAEDALQRGAVAASRVRSAGARAIDKARAAMVAQGMDPEGAGLMDLLTGIGLNAETDALTETNNAARQAWGYRNQATASRFEGEAAGARAKQDMYGSILTGAGQALASYNGKPRKPGEPVAPKVKKDGLSTE